MGDAAEGKRWEEEELGDSLSHKRGGTRGPTTLNNERHCERGGVSYGQALEESNSKGSPKDQRKAVAKVPTVVPESGLG